jgi:pimeloyl-ACP methyl ester carboxylesterase
MRTAALMVLIAACATESTPIDPPPDPFELAWSESIRPGDLIVGIPGTGAYSGLGARIEAMHGDVEGSSIIEAAEVLEGSIAAARRAGISDADIEAGAVELGMWGAGITKLASFKYHSLDGLHVTFTVLGGLSKCGTGGIPENIVNYNQGNAEADTLDLYQRLVTYLGKSPRDGRQVTIVSHSWGGLVAEYFATHLAALETDHGGLSGAEIAFVISAGVPSFVPGYTPPGPGYRTYEQTVGDLKVAPRMYEVDRPDDPVHTLDLTRNGGGHHYIIEIGAEYHGWYGITTDELACAGVAGICPAR